MPGGIEGENGKRDARGHRMVRGMPGGKRSLWINTQLLVNVT